jgi:hypothetical protein
VGALPLVCVLRHVPVPTHTSDCCLVVDRIRLIRAIMSVRLACGRQVAHGRAGHGIVMSGVGGAVDMCIVRTYYVTGGVGAAAGVHRVQYAVYLTCDATQEWKILNVYVNHIYGDP